MDLYCLPGAMSSAAERIAILDYFFFFFKYIWNIKKKQLRTVPSVQDLL